MFQIFYAMFKQISGESNVQIGLKTIELVNQRRLAFEAM